MGTQLDLIPEFHFTGDKDPDLIAGFNEFVAFNPVENREVKDVEMREKVELICSAINAHYIDLGIDISNRIVKSEKIHFLKKKEFVELALSLEYSTDVRAFFSSTYFRIFINVDEISFKAEFLKLLCHELLHSLAFRKIYFSNEKKTFDVRQLGFKSEKRDNYLLEGFIDLSTMQIIKSRWRNYSLLKRYAREAFFSVTYVRGVVLLDAIFEYIEANSEYSYHSFLTAMQKDYIYGTDDSFSILKEIFGPQRFRYLMAMRYLKDIEALIKLAEKLELHEFVAEWIAAGNGKNYEYGKKL